MYKTYQKHIQNIGGLKMLIGYDNGMGNNKIFYKIGKKEFTIDFPSRVKKINEENPDTYVATNINIANTIHSPIDLNIPLLHVLLFNFPCFAATRIPVIKSTIIPTKKTKNNVSNVIFVSISIIPF